MNKNRLWISSFLFILVAIFVLSTADFLSNSINELFFPPSAVKPIAQINEIKGQFFILQNNHDWSPRNKAKGYPLANYSAIKVDTNSTLTLELNTNLNPKERFVLILRPKSEFQLKLFEKENLQSPIYLYLHSGDYLLKTKGKPGSLFIIKEGRIFDPSYRPEKPLPIIRIGKESSSSSENEDEESLKDSNTDSSEKSKEVADNETALQVLPDDQSEKDKTDTISSEEFEEELKKSRLSFYRCQANSLRENEEVKGKILVQLRVLPTGKVEKVTFLKNEIDYPNFNRCLESVFRRTQFKKFSGTPILFNFPLDFE